MIGRKINKKNFNKQYELKEKKEKRSFEKSYFRAIINFKWHKIRESSVKIFHFQQKWSESQEIYYDITYISKNWPINVKKLTHNLPDESWREAIALCRKLKAFEIFVCLWLDLDHLWGMSLLNPGEKTCTRNFCTTRSKRIRVYPKENMRKQIMKWLKRR